MPITRNVAKRKMQQGEMALGFQVYHLRSIATPLLAAASGHDFLFIDMEHGAFSMQEATQICIAALPTGVAPLVRVCTGALDEGTRLLDNGAMGIVVPHVDTAAMARDVLRFARYAPLGERGMDLYARAARYSHTPKQEYLKQANQALLALQIEGSDGLRNLEEILAVPGSDVIFIGPYDLSQSLGHPGEIEHPEVVAAIERTIAVVRNAGRHVGIYADDAATARKWIDLGVQFIALCVDTTIFYRACKQLVADLRG